MFKNGGILKEKVLILEKNVKYNCTNLEEIYRQIDTHTHTHTHTYLLVVCPCGDQFIVYFPQAETCVSNGLHTKM